MHYKEGRIMADTKIILGEINITHLLNAHEALKNGLIHAKTELEQDGVIQRFEFTYELVWKTIKRILAFKGIIINNPRDVFREAAKQKLINDPKVWFEFIRKRNLTSHIYNRSCAQEIFESLPLFEREVSQLIKTLNTL